MRFFFVFHDEMEIKDKNGNRPIDPHTGLPSATTGISYRSEPMRNRKPLTEEHSDTGEDISMSSWVHGDPATPVFKAYTGERVVFRLMMPADKPRNVGFCIHGHEWKELDERSCTHRRAVQGAVSIGNTFDIELENGASRPGGLFVPFWKFEMGCRIGDVGHLSCDETKFFM